MSKVLNSYENLLADQKKFMESCGGSLTGYIARYGDPGIPPLDDVGNPKVVDGFHLNEELRSRLVPVPGREGIFYVNMVGEGGTKIYGADLARLKYYENRVEELRRRQR